MCRFRGNCSSLNGIKGVGEVGVVALAAAMTLGFPFKKANLRLESPPGSRERLRRIALPRRITTGEGAWWGTSGNRIHNPFELPISFVASSRSVSNNPEK